MALTKKEVNRLRRIIALAETMIAESEKPRLGRPPLNKVKRTGQGKRIRRSGKELLAFRKRLMADRRRGVPVTELAEKHGISTAYIYSLR